jgi:hypothetical protein
LAVTKSFLVMVFIAMLSAERTNYRLFLWP